MHSVPIKGHALCGYRHCRRYLPAQVGRGPRRAFCDVLCRRRERSWRERQPPQPRPRGAVREGARRYTVGHRFDDTTLTLLAHIPADQRTGTYVLVRCDCGNNRELQLRYVASRRTRNCSDRTRHRDSRKVTDPSYSTIHQQLTKTWGTAKALPCAFCAHVGEGNQWSYRYSSYEARSALGNKKDRGRVFSVDLGDYWVLCRSHHQRFDRRHRATVPSGQLSLAHIALAMAYQPDYQAWSNANDITA